MPPKAKIKTGKIVRVSIDEVVPYWRNPRRVTGEAVEALKQSIAAYGYQQPVVVDGKNVIIIGHTRYAAMRRLGYEEIDVMIVDYLSEAQVKQLRVIDNRAAEYTSWDLDQLLAELGDLDSDLMRSLFSDIQPDGSMKAEKSYIDDTRDFSGEWDEVDPKVEFVCPSCFHPFEAEVTHDDIMKGRIEPSE
jgi:hypothetical protein